MDLRFTDEQEMLRQTVRELCAKQSTSQQVRAIEDDPTGYRPELWDGLTHIGLAGLTIDEEHGGLGRSALDLVVVYEELGRALAITPHFVSSVMAAGLLGAGSDRAAAKEWLPRIAGGDAVVSIAWFEVGGGCGRDGIRARARGDRLTGTKTLVPFAAAADAFVALARDDDGVGVYLVDAQAAGVAVTPIRAMAREAVGEVAFADTPATRIGDWATWETVATDGMIALAASAVGGAEHALEMAIAYAKERVQFDRPIGSFQGIAHPIADMATEIDGSKVVTYEAAWAREQGHPTAGLLAAMAKYQAADAFKRTTKVGEQTLGGIGFTLEIDMQLYFRRAKQLEITWWDPAYLAEVIAAAELDAADPFVGVEARYEG